MWSILGLSVCLHVRPTVRLPVRSTAAAACGGFAAERPVGRRYRSTASCQLQARRAAGTGAQQQMRAESR